MGNVCLGLPQAAKAFQTYIEIRFTGYIRSLLVGVYVYGPRFLGIKAAQVPTEVSNYHG